MNKVVIRFYVVKSKSYFEVIFDNRLSFIENFYLLYNIYPMENIRFIYDPYIQKILKADIPIKEFNITNQLTLYLFN